MKYLYLTLLLLAGCGKNPPAMNAPASQPELPIDTAVSAQLSLTLEPQPKPNQYFVRIKIQNPPAAEWFIQRSVNSERSLPLCNRNSCKNEFLDTSPRSGTEIAYTLVLISGEKVATERIHIPSDLVVSSLVRSSALTRHRRLFLEAKGRIITEGADTELNFDEIHSQDGTLATFPENQTAEAGKTGRPGGILVLRAKVVTGTLNISAIGETGGKGARGITGITGGKGFTGTTGLPTCQWPANLDPTAPHALPGNRRRPNGESQCFHWVDDYRREKFPWAEQYTKACIRCATPPSNGTSGLPGSPGFPGGDGLRGGASAKLTVEIDNPTNLKLNVLVEGGKGGVGGDGGYGGAGGPGGDPGAQDPYGACPKMASGPQGPTGPLGPLGREGIPGEKLTYCFKLGKEEGCR